jgi:mitochondrial fission protein ELM1
MNNRPIIWLLLGDKTGDNNQLLALADRLEMPVVAKKLSYNLARAIPPRFLGTARVSLTAEARQQLVPPWPDLVIAIGRRSVATARWLKARHGAKIVLVGHPRVDPRHFDLVITTRQYPVPHHDNVVLLPMPLSRLQPPTERNAAETAMLDALPRPHLLLAIGGPTKSWALSEDVLRSAVDALVARASSEGGSVIAVGSRRTPPAIGAAVRDGLGGGVWVDDPAVRFATLLHDADAIFVTADSISMMSEAIQTGRPVGLVPIQLTPSGRRRLGETAGRKPHRTRDLRRIWSYLEDHGLVGTIGEPKAGDWNSEAIARAVDAVRALVDGKADA